MFRIAWRRKLLAAACVGLATTVCSFETIAAQEHPAASGSTQPQMMAKDADPDWEVVTVRPSDPNATNNTFDVRGRHVIIGHRTVEIMLRMAYSLQESQIVGAPDWTKTKYFDADGVPNVEGQPNLKQFQTMVRKLLSERFGLVAHVEQRELPVYALSMTRSGPRMTNSTGDPDGLPNDTDHRSAGQQSVKMSNATMGDLVLELMFYTDRPVVDQTGLNGRHDFTLKWTFDESKAPTDGTAAPSLFTAIQEQLGLKLEPVKAPVPVLVIDKVEPPSAN